MDRAGQGVAPRRVHRRTAERSVSERNPACDPNRNRFSRDRHGGCKVGSPPSDVFNTRQPLRQRRPVHRPSRHRHAHASHTASASGRPPGRDGPSYRRSGSARRRARRCTAISVTPGPGRRAGRSAWPASAALIGLTFGLGGRPAGRHIAGGCRPANRRPCRRPGSAASSRSARAARDHTSGPSVTAFRSGDSSRVADEMGRDADPEGPVLARVGREKTPRARGLGRCRAGRRIRSALSRDRITSRHDRPCGPVGGPARAGAR